VRTGARVHSQLTLSTDTLMQVGGLSPETAYVFRIRARDVAGWGAWSAKVTIYTRRLAPSRVPKVVGRSWKPHSIHTRWVPWCAFTLRPLAAR
jgi:hypothetical protein